MNSLTEDNPSPGGTDILALLEQKSAAAFYQPIISVKKKAVVGLETLGRGIDPQSRQLIDPDSLLEISTQKNKNLDLDRLFRHKGLEGFQEIRGNIPGLLLFLGIETSVLTPEVVGSGNISQMVRDKGLDPNSVVIELSKSQGKDPGALKNFVENYKSQDFLVSLKDVDAGRSSLDRILHLNPDVLKTDPQLSTSLSKDSYKRDDFRTLVQLSHRMGSLVVANGIENEEDALAALELGADMLQGGYFSKPQRAESSTTLGLKARIVFIAARFKRQLTERLTRDKDRKTRYEKIVGDVFSGFEGVPPETLEAKFPGCLRAFPQLECLYLLNQDGAQETETVCNIRKVAERKKYLFQPAPKGTDHSLKDYYYSLIYNGLERYFTEPYISLASGNLCVTAAGILREAPGRKPYILCLDIDVTRI